MRKTKNLRRTNNEERSEGAHPAYNQIATIVEVELIRKGGKGTLVHHLKVDKKPDLWLDSSELGGLVERCRITFHDDRGQELYFDVERDYGKENLSMTLTGRQKTSRSIMESI